MNVPDLSELEALLRDAARAELLPRFSRADTTHKPDGSIVTAADIAMQERVQATLAERWPQYGFLGEEMSASEQAQALEAGGEGLWCLDPLDGTTNYAAGIPFFGVSLTLLIHGAPALGIVHDPSRDETFSGVRGQGAFLNGEPLRLMAADRPLQRAIAGVDFKRLSNALASRIAQGQPYASQRNFGSCALEWAWLAAGRVHVYLHGGQKLWDYAAGTLLFAEAGGYSQTLEGEAVFSARGEPRSVVAAVDRALFTEWARWLADAPDS